MHMYTYKYMHTLNFVRKHVSSNILISAFLWFFGLRQAEIALRLLIRTVQSTYVHMCYTLS